MSKKSESDFQSDVIQSLETIVTKQARYKEELFRALKPLADIGEKEQLFENFETGVRSLGRGQTSANIPLRTACEAVLRHSPKKRAFLHSAAMVLCRGNRALFGDAENDFIRSMERQQQRALTTGDGDLGQAVSVIEELAADIYALLHHYAAFRTLGVVPLDGGKRKLASVTGKAAAVWLKPASQGTAFPETVTLGGNSISPEVSTVGALIKVSGELLADGKVTFEGALLMALVEGLGYRLDYTCFQGNGTDDMANGEMTGIFVDANIESVAAQAGHSSVALLDADDFANLIGGVDSSALSYPCRYWISPEHLPKLLKIRISGPGSDRLLTPPASKDDEWRIHGFPVTWAAGAPGTDVTGDKVAAFGREDAYTVALRQEFEVASSPHPGFLENSYQFRAIARARCLTRDASSLATLKTTAPAA